MKMKLIVASMAMLGFISNSALAGSTSSHKPLYAKNETTIVGLKGEGLQTCPKVNFYKPIMEAMSQNIGRAWATVDCNKPIQLSGGINFDTQFGNLSQGFMGENNSRFTVNDAYLDVVGHVNAWVDAFIEFSYNSIQDHPLALASTFPDPLFFIPDPKPGLYGFTYTENLDVEQAFITVGSPEFFPLYLKLGKQYVDYGRYVIHPITRSMTQVMTETLQTAAELSFISAAELMYLHGSLFAFQNPLTHTNDEFGTVTENTGKTTWGAQLGFGRLDTQLGWDIGVGYTNNMTGVNDIAYALTTFKFGTHPESFDVEPGEGTYFKRVDALTAYGMINSGPFSLSGHYVTALRTFDITDLNTIHISDDEVTVEFDGAKPWAADLQAAFAFNYWGRSQNLFVGYQHSGDAVNLYLPESRWVAGYGIDVLKNTNVGLEYAHDHDYSTKHGGTGEDSNRFAVRVALKFG